MESLSEPINSYHDANSCGERSWGSDNPDIKEAGKPIMCQSDIRKDFKLLVKNIAYDIKDLKKLIYMSDAVQDGAQSALDILWELERKGVFAFDNVGPLEKLLKDIDRFDLISKHLVSYKLKYGEVTVNGAFSQKKPPAMHRVGSSPIPQGSPMSSTRRSTPISYHHVHAKRQLVSLPGSLRNLHRQARFTVVPEEETAEQSNPSEVFSQHGFSSLPSDATVVPNLHSWSVRSHTHTPSGQRPVTFTQYNRCSEDNDYSWRTMTQQSHDQGIHDFPQLSLPNNLSNLQHRTANAGRHSLLPYQPSTGIEQGGACNTNHTLQKEPPIQDDESILEFPLSDMEAGMTHSLQSQRSMHDSGFEGTASASSSASKNTDTAQRSEKSHCWDVDQRLLFNGLKPRKVGKSLKAEKFTFPVGCKYSRNPVISMRVIPLENSHSRHVTLVADLLIPKKCSKRKWLVEYCSCSCVLTVKVIDLTTNKIIGQDKVEKELVASPGVDDDYRMMMRLPNLLHHDDIIYRNNTKHFKFQATLCLLEHGFKEDVTANDYQTSPNEDHGFEVIDLP